MTVHAASLAARYDATITMPAMLELYGESGYFNVGYWVDGVRDLPAACGRLVDEVTSAVPHDAAVILDVGCGLGAGTKRIMSQFPAALVVGVNVSVWQLAQARSRGVRNRLFADATSLAVADATVDAVLAIESAEHFDTREEFFAEAHRVLRTGGVLSLADMLFHEGDAISDEMMLPRMRVRTVEEYEEALLSAGFVDATVSDVTTLSWTPYWVEMRRVFQRTDDAMQRMESSLAHYVIASARRK